MTLSFNLGSQLLTVASFSKPVKYSRQCSSSYNTKTPVKLLKSHVHFWPSQSLLGKSFSARMGREREMGIS